jgi:hypothetical protein
VSEEFTIRKKLGHQKKTLLSFDDFVKSDNMAVSNFLEYLDLSHYPLHVPGSHLALVDDLDSHFLAGRQVQCQMHLTKRSFPDVLA